MPLTSCALLPFVLKAVVFWFQTGQQIIDWGPDPLGETAVHTQYRSIASRRSHWHLKCRCSRQPGARWLRSLSVFQSARIQTSTKSRSENFKRQSNKFVERLILKSFLRAANIFWLMVNFNVGDSGLSKGILGYYACNFLS